MLFGGFKRKEQTHTLCGLCCATAPHKKQGVKRFVFFLSLEEVLYPVTPQPYSFPFCRIFSVQAVLEPLLCSTRTVMLQDATTCSSSRWPTPPPQSTRWLDSGWRASSLGYDSLLMLQTRTPFHMLFVCLYLNSISRLKYANNLLAWRLFVFSEIEISYVTKGLHIICISNTETELRCRYVLLSILGAENKSVVQFSK